MNHRQRYAKMKIIALACFVTQLAYVFGAILPIDNEIIEDNSLTEDTLIRVDRNDVTFRLYTRQNPTTYTELFTGNLHATIDATKPCKFIIHGYMNDAGLPWVLKMKDEYLKKGDYNVIAVDWSGPAQTLYPATVVYIRDVAKFLGEFLVDLINSVYVPAANIHLVGHSLGAQISGLAGQNVTNILGGTKVGRISGLDPAGPLFWTNEEDERLSPNDADYVDVIHTDGGKFGYFFECGHADFYPEAGLAPQPGCVTRLDLDFASCSHVRSHALFTESINSSGFKAVQCVDYFQFIARQCGSNAPAAIMGENIQIGSEGRFYLSTNSAPPYATNGVINYRL